MVNYSIIIPHKNVPELLERCVASIPERDDVQIIVVDDGSDTPPTIERSGVEVVYSEGKNAGAARNIGMARARGKWLIFADADDFFLPALNEMMDKYVDSEADIVFFDNIWLDSETLLPNHDTYHKRHIKTYLQTGNEEGIRYGTFAPWSKFVRREMVERHNLRFSEIMFSNDVLFSTMSGYYATNIKCDISSPIYSHIIRSESLSGTANDVNVESLVIRFNEDVVVRDFMHSVGINSYSERTLLKRWKRIMRLDRHKAMELLPVMRLCYSSSKIAGLRLKMAFDPLVQLFRAKKLSESMKTNGAIPIFLASDNNYAPFVATTAASVMANTASRVDFIVLDGGISKRNKRRILSLAGRFPNMSMRFENVDIGRHMEGANHFQSLVKHITVATYNHFLMASVGVGISKAIYLDVDIILMDDVAKLYNVDLEGKLLGACWLCDNNGIVKTPWRHISESMRFADDYHYFNAGVLLVDLEGWRRENIEDKLFKAEREWRDRLVCADKDVLNKVFENNYKELDLAYNFTTTVAQDAPDADILAQNMVVRHFTMSSKPWSVAHGSHIKNSADFWRYAKMTPFYCKLRRNYIGKKIKREIKRLIKK